MIASDIWVHGPSASGKIGLCSALPVWYHRVSLGFVTITLSNLLIMLLQESNVRAAFVAPPGWVLLGADYKQLELRLMAHFSGDSILLSALSSAADPFVELAANWLGLEVHQVSTCSTTWSCGLRPATTNH
jgi:hypothetical protein